MGYVNLNLAVYFRHDCTLVPAWRMDLVIQKCNNRYVIDYDPKIIDRLAAENPGYTFTAHDYMGHRCIKMLPVTAGDHCNDVLIPLLGGDSYKIMARMCHMDNEWTSSIYVNIPCVGPVCEKLLLNTKTTCVENDVLAIGVDAVKLNRIPHDVIRQYLAVMRDVGMLTRDKLAAMQGDRIADLQDAGAPPEEQVPNDTLLNIINQLPMDYPIY